MASPEVKSIALRCYCNNNQMDMKGVEMDMEMENSNVTRGGTSGPVVHNHQQAEQVLGGNMRDLLGMARYLVSQGKPSLALQAVVMAVKCEGGDTAVFQTLQRAREMYLNRLQSNNMVDQLASLFAECAIAEAQPLTPTTLVARDDSSMVTSIDETSILAESGRKQIVLDAYLDGSSFVCLQCGGLVSNLRRDEHLAYWCCGPQT